jgi:hypothetical protein
LAGQHGIMSFVLFQAQMRELGHPAVQAFYFEYVPAASILLRDSMRRVEAHSNRTIRPDEID